MPEILWEESVEKSGMLTCYLIFYKVVPAQIPYIVNGSLCCQKGKRRDIQKMLSVPVIYLRSHPLNVLDTRSGHRKCCVFMFALKSFVFPIREGLIFEMLCSHMLSFVC